jgi:hypothetical protein
LLAVAIHLEVFGAVFEGGALLDQPSHKFALLHIMLDLLGVEMVLF